MLEKYKWPMPAAALCRGLMLMLMPIVAIATRRPISARLANRRLDRRLDEQGRQRAHTRRVSAERWPMGDSREERRDLPRKKYIKTKRHRPQRRQRKVKPTSDLRARVSREGITGGLWRMS